MVSETSDNETAIDKDARSGSDTLPSFLSAIKENRAYQLARKTALFAVTRSVKALAEFTAVCLGLGILWLAMLVSVMGKGEADVSFLKQNFALWFAQAYDGQDADIARFKVQWHPEREALGFLVEDIIVKDEADQTLLTVGSIYSETPITALLNKGFEARRLDLKGGQFTIKRESDGAISGAIGTPESFGKLGPVIAIAGPTGRGADDGSFIDAVSLNGTTVFFRDENIGLAVDFSHVDFQTTISDTEIIAMGAADIMLSAGEDARLEDGKGPHTQVSIRRDLLEDKALDISIDMVGLNPANLNFDDERLKLISHIDMPLNIRSNWRDAGEKERRVSFDVENIEGQSGIVLPNIGALKNIDFSGEWDFSADEFELDDINIKADGLDFTGRMFLSNMKAQFDARADGYTQGDIAAKPMQVSLDLDAVKWASDGIFAEPLDVKSGHIKAEYRSEEDRFDLSQVLLPFDTYTFGLSGHGLNVFNQDQDRTKSLVLNGQLDGNLSRTDLLNLWPTAFVLGGRNWIENAVVDAQLYDVTFDVNIPDFSVLKDGVPDDIIAMDFKVNDAHIKYIKTMTPMEQASGYGQLRGNSLDVTLTGGRVGDLSIIGGSVDMPQFFPFGSRYEIDIEGTGPVTNMVELVDQKPFEYARIYALLPEDFSGQGRAKLNINLPLREFLKEGDVEYNIEVSGSDIDAPFGFEDFKLTEGDLVLTADKTGMSLMGPANIGPFASHVNWRENFDNGATPTQLNLTSHVDNTLLDKLGLGLREYFGGHVPIRLEATGEGVSFNSAKISADLENSELVFGHFWSKSAGQAGHVNLSITSHDDGKITVDDLLMSAPGLDVDGALKLDSDFRLLEAGLNKLVIDDLISARVTANRAKPDQPLKATLTGDLLNLDGIVGSTLRQGEGDASLPMILTANVNVLRLAQNYQVNKANLLYNHTGEEISQFRFSGESEGGPVILDFKTLDDGPFSNKLSFDVANASDAVDAFFALDNIRGGRLYGEAVRPRDGEDILWSGTLNVDDFVLTEAPVLAQILSIGSLDGLGNVLGGDGLEFETIELPFTWGEGVLGLEAARAAGPALGLTSDGAINIREQTIDLDGTLIPAYAANSFFGSIPILGDIFGGDADDAALGLTYNVQGGFNQAQVSVNPLSALTPGVLRQVFKPKREKKRIELPSEAEPESNIIVLPKAEP